MNPAFSVIIFTTLAGSAQGILLCLALTVLTGSVPTADLPLAFLLATAFGLLTTGLMASFFHLGRPERAWRAARMWRTSWLSREVIVLPLLLGVVAWWWCLEVTGRDTSFLPVLAILAVLALWICTSMIYISIRFIQEWAHPMTAIHFLLTGLSSGLVWVVAIALAMGHDAFATVLLPWAAVVTLAAGTVRMLSLHRNARLRPVSTLQSATGIQASKLTQKSMGMSAGAFNTREFFHQVSLAGFRKVRLLFLLLAFALPTAYLGWAMVTGIGHLIWLVLPVQTIGLLAERWFFFAQAQHPQNLYYQVVS